MDFNGQWTMDQSSPRGPIPVLLQTSPARNGKLDGKGGGNKGIDGWEDTVMGSGVSSVRFIWYGAVLWRYGDTYIVKRSR